jgi:adenylyltransferase/sulfurtransferase
VARRRARKGLAFSAEPSYRRSAQEWRLALTDAEIARYSRQLILPGLGPGEQERIRAARVHVVGAGAVAGPALICLAQAGVGTVYLDDGADVAEGDASSWLYGPAQVGQPRLFPALEALRAASAFVEVRPYGSTGARPTAALVCLPTRVAARAAAERARRAGLPHVVALAEGEEGEVVAVPPGAPCFSCASRSGTSLHPQGSAATTAGLLGALELILMLGRLAASGESGRHVRLGLGLPRVEPTSRLPGCDCAHVY